MTITSDDACSHFESAAMWAAYRVTFKLREPIPGHDRRKPFIRNGNRIIPDTRGVGGSRRAYAVSVGHILYPVRI